MTTNKQVNEVTMTNEQAVELLNDLQKYKLSLTEFKGDSHMMAYRTLVHVHNTAQLSAIQEFYNILSEDKFLSKSGYARWIQEYAPVKFSDETKKFSIDKAVNSNPNSPKKLYVNDADKGSALLGIAFGKRFWDMGKDDEDVNPTTWDVFSVRLEKMLKRGAKDMEKGEIVGEDVAIMSTILANLASVQEAIKPHTTAEIMKKEATKKVA